LTSGPTITLDDGAVSDDRNLADKSLDALLGRRGLFRGEGQQDGGFDFAKVHDLLQRFAVVPVLSAASSNLGVQAGAAAFHPRAFFCRERHGCSIHLQ